MNIKTVSREQCGIRGKSQGLESDEPQLYDLELQFPYLFCGNSIRSPLQG